MIKKEIACVAFRDRIESVKDECGLKTFIRNPTRPADDDDLNAVFLIEGVDTILEYSSRGGNTFPVKRAAEIIIEIVTNAVDADGVPINIKEIFSTVRRAVFVNINPVAEDGKVDKTTFFREIRTEGPLGYGLPNILGMRLVLELFYIDNG